MTAAINPALLRAPIENCPVHRILVDRTNFQEHRAVIAEAMKNCFFTGIDVETTNRYAHPGILKLEDKKTTFDIRRTVMTGLSLYPDGHHTAYYLNLNHKDEENRLPWKWVKELLDEKPKEASWIAHNAPFELVMFQACYGYTLENLICSLQLCVSAYNDDSYPISKFATPSVHGMAKVMPQLRKAFAGWIRGVPMTEEQDELLYKIIAKESKAQHSYNGLIKDISYGYGLKQAIASWAEYKMETYEEVLKACNAERMDDLTGAQAAQYGADDAFWCVWLFHRITEYILETNPGVLGTFYDQENPMIPIYAQIRMNGLRVDKKKILEKQTEEREKAAKVLQAMKEAIREVGQFEPEPYDKLYTYDKRWYPQHYERMRAQIMTWAWSPDEMDPFAELMKVRSPVSNAWATELGQRESTGPNIGYYMTMRVVLYDLCRFSFQLANGKVQSDGDARVTMMSRYAKRWAEARGKTRDQVYDRDKDKVLDEGLLKDPKVRVLLAYKELAGIEQRMKLYITPYLLLVDPETDRMYPILSSMLNTRRTSCQEPNGQQLSKYGDGGYIRGFFIPDEDDHVLVSADWSAVELVIIGEYSQDPAFLEAYGQRPHRDLHSWAASKMFRQSVEDFKKRPDYKELRTKVGKPANFGYWYSGALGAVANEMGWTSEEMWEFVEVYREAFADAENWRVSTINEVRYRGFVELPDGHRRDRFEATQRWADIMRYKFGTWGLQELVEVIIRKIQTRAGNQSVNALVQGLCATLAKRKMLKLVNDLIPRKGYRARLWLLVHDELVCSVHKDDAVAFMDDLYELMIDGEGLFQHVQLDSSLAVGRSFEPFDAKKAPRGQIELMELNSGLTCVPEDRWKKAATREERQKVIDYLFSEAA